MKVRVLGAFGSEGPGQRPSCFLVDDRLLLDAGSVTGGLAAPEQAGIEHALLSHSHLDHIAGAAFLAESLACQGRREPVTLGGAAAVMDALRTRFFNGAVWPDFSRPVGGQGPVVAYRTLAEDVEQRVGHVWVTPVAVSHTVPATGFIVHDGSSGVVYSGDTGPTTALWEAARGQPGLRAVILECAFPNRLGTLAALSKHMTPDLIRRELDKLPPQVAVWIFHIKPQFHAETAEELSRIDGGRVVLLEQDKTYSV